MNRKGWEASFLVFVALFVIVIVVISILAIVSVVLTVQLSHDIDSEQHFITPFLVTYALVPVNYDERSFFQMMSYESFGEAVYPELESTMTQKSGIFANDYILSLYYRRLVTTGAIRREEAFGSYIPVFTFEKKDEKFVVLT